MDDKQIAAIVGDVTERLRREHLATGQTTSPPSSAAPTHSVSSPAAPSWKRFDDPPVRKWAASFAAPRAHALGVFPTVAQAFEAAREAERQFRSVTLERRFAIVDAMRRKLRQNVEELSRMAVEETGLGRSEDKVQKNLLVINKTPGPEILRPVAVSGDRGLMLTEPAPYGVIGSITPSTNPTETVINNGIGMIAAGNAVVFNAHPSATRVTLRTLSLCNEAMVEAGGPAHLFTSCAEPSIETAQELMRTPGVRLLVVTGGAGVVQAAFASGKKVIAAGPGNPPSVVDETADILKAAQGTVAGASLDNNIICVSEKETFCVASVIDAFLAEMVKAGCVLLSAAQARELRKHVLLEDRGPGRMGVVNRELIGKNASVLLQKIGVRAPDTVRLAVFKAEPDEPLVWTEQLMPVYPVVPVADSDEGIDLAVRAEHGFGHTATMWSRNIDQLSVMARAINTSIFVKNGPSYAGLGFGGEGHTSFTIASPTGEGLTTARHFSRDRRCTLVDHFRIV